MMHSTKLTALAAAITLSLTACGGGGGGSGDTAGIGGSGFVSSGTITGFGSVFVNGVKFETDSSSFDIEGISGTQNDLAIGMVVRVNGVINPDGVTGTATSIIFDDDLQGPVAGLPVITAATLTAEFTVLGIKVRINRKTTSFDGTGFNFDSIANNNNIEISGFFDANGTLVATRVKLEDIAFDATSQVEIKGTIANWDGANFTINGISVDASSATLDDLPNGLSNGIRVEVEGTYNGTTITAREIESDEFEFDDANEFEVEGFITDYVSNSSFKVNGIPVDASAASFSPAGLTLQDNLQIEAEGSIVGGILKAEEIKMRDGDVEIQAPVSSIDPLTNTFKVEPVSTQFITIHVGAETKFENDITDRESLLLSDLRVGDFVEIEGYEKSAGNVFASEVSITETDDIEVQGIIESDPRIGNIKVLGVEFVINGATIFEDDDDNTISRLPDFNDLVTRDQSWIKVEDEYPSDGVADKIEIETP